MELEFITELGLPVSRISLSAVRFPGRFGEFRDPASTSTLAPKACESLAQEPVGFEDEAKR
jgi:hypothetical protein